MYEASKNRVCAFTYVNEKDLPNGQKLLTCSKCKETCYIDRQAQASDWKYHKKTCRPLSSEQFAIVDDCQSASDVLDKMEALLLVPQLIVGRHFLYCLQKLKTFSLGDRNNHDTASEVTRPLLSDILFSKIINFADERGIRTLFSIPGFANFILSDDLLMSPAMKGLKDIGEEPRSLLHAQYLAPWYQAIILNMMGLCSFVECPRGREIMVPRILPLAEAVTKRIMQWWNCNYTRESSNIHIPFSSADDMFHCNEGFVSAYIFGRESRKEGHFSLKDKELLPGMTVKQILLILIRDFPLLARYSLKTLLGFRIDVLSTDIETRYAHRDEYEGDREQDIKNSPWRHFSPQERVEVLDKMYSWDPSSSYLIKETQEWIQVFCFSHSTKMLFEIHDLAFDDPRHDPLLLSDLRATRLMILEASFPLVNAYIGTVEPLYILRSINAGFEPLSFPEDVIPIIAQFCSPSHRYLIPRNPNFLRGIACSSS